MTSVGTYNCEAKIKNVNLLQECINFQDFKHKYNEDFHM